MLFSKTLLFSILSIGAIAMPTDAATEAEAAPSNFCSRLGQDERRQCKADRLEYCRRIDRDVGYRRECRDDASGPTINGSPPYFDRRGPVNNYPPGSIIIQPGPTSSFEQYCASQNWNQLNNDCIQACHNNGRQGYCQAHCDNIYRKIQRGDRITPPRFCLQR